MNTQPANYPNIISELDNFLSELSPEVSQGDRVLQGFVNENVVIQLKIGTRKFIEY